MAKNKLALNTIASFSNQIVTIVCGFILPHYLIVSFGSTINGLVVSITQFLHVIAFMQMGVGAVVQSSFYKPLALNDEDEVSKIFVSAQKFFRLIATIFAVYAIVLAFIYPVYAGQEFDYWFSSSLILIIAFNSFAQYYFGLTNQMLLWADQRAYLSLFIDSLLLIVNTIVSVVVIKMQGNIQLVKLSTTCIYLVRPFFLTQYVNKHYRINKKIQYTKEPIKQKWNGFAQHLASSVMDNTDVIILTVFSELNSISIYYIYHLVENGIRQLITSLTVGVQSYFGRVLAVDNLNETKRIFGITEFAFHFVVTLLYSCVGLLIIPFVDVYAIGVEDIDYHIPLFAYIITLAHAVYCYRLVYFMMIKAAGHYKQTQSSAIIEMIINLSTSILFVIKYGLIGVAVGTLAATTYRTVYFINYLAKNIIYISVKKTSLLLLNDLICAVLSFAVCSQFSLKNYTYISWIALAFTVGCCCVFISAFVNWIYLLLYDRSILQIVRHYIKKRIK